MYSIFYFDYRELSKIPRSLHSPIRSLILLTILVCKHFNFLARLHACILYVRVNFKNHHNIFLACPVGHIFVKHHFMDSFFAEDATKVKK